MGKQQMKKIQTYTIIAAFAGYVIWNLILLWNHEPWRDEANVWLMARDLTPVQLLKEIKYQGHPCLWYFFVMPFAKLGLPFRTIGILSTAVMAVAAWFYLQRSSQHLLIKLLVLFSPICTYFYPTIARNYCLVALFLILLAVNYPERNTHPMRYGLLLGLLVQSDTIGIAPAGMITTVWLVENLFGWMKQKDRDRLIGCLKGAWIPLISLLFYVVQFYQVSDSPVFQIRESGIREMVRETRNYLYVILIRVTGWQQAWCMVFFLLVFLLMLVVSFRIRNVGGMVVLLANCLFQCVFSVLVYQLHIWHYLSLCITFLWMLWVMDDTAKEKNLNKDRIYRIASGTLSACMGILALFMFIHWNSPDEVSNLQNALHGSYSDGANTAAYIKEYLDSDDLLITTDVCMESTIAAFLKEYRFYYAGTGKEETYADWSERQSGIICVEDLLTWVKDVFPEKKEAYLIQGGDSCICDPDKLDAFEIIYETDGMTVRNEEYVLYRITVE